MEFLYKKSIVHGDLATRNVLLTSDLTAKLSDFGLSAIQIEDEAAELRSLKCPIRWMAPESLRDRVMTSSSDVWSFGITLWEIFSVSSRPYRGKVTNNNCRFEVRRIFHKWNIFKFTHFQKKNPYRFPFQCTWKIPIIIFFQKDSCFFSLFLHVSCQPTQIFMKSEMRIQMVSTGRRFMTPEVHKCSVPEGIINRLNNYAIWVGGHCFKIVKRI